MLLERNHPESARILGLAEHAARRCREFWWRDDAVASHRYGMTHWYVGPFRLMEGSLLVLASLAEVASKMREIDRQRPELKAEQNPAVLWPEQDTWIPFDERGPGAWCYRHGRLAFQLPLVDGFTSDYCAAPTGPGLFEQVTDKGMPCGVPVVHLGDKRFLPLRRPTNVAYTPGQLRWRTEGWTHCVDWDWWKGIEDRPGSREALVRVEGNAIVGEETWTFGEVPSAAGMWFGESETPLRVEWGCNQPHRVCSVVVDGMPEWRSPWGPIRRLHQIDIEPAREIKVRYRLFPV